MISIVTLFQSCTPGRFFRDMLQTCCLVFFLMMFLSCATVLETEPINAKIPVSDSSSLILEEIKQLEISLIVLHGDFLEALEAKEKGDVKMERALLSESLLTSLELSARMRRISESILQTEGVFKKFVDNPYPAPTVLDSTFHRLRLLAASSSLGLEERVGYLEKILDSPEIKEYPGFEVLAQLDISRLYLEDGRTTESVLLFRNASVLSIENEFPEVVEAEEYINKMYKKLYEKGQMTEKRFKDLTGYSYSKTIGSRINRRDYWIRTYGALSPDQRPRGFKGYHQSDFGDGFIFSEWIPVLPMLSDRAIEFRKIIIHACDDKKKRLEKLR